MRDLLLAGFGGFLGSSLRFGIAQAIARAKGGSSFPLETLVVNATGCLVIGILGGLFETRGTLDPATRAFLFAGVLGGYTTFSAFGAETFQLLRSGAFGFAALSIAAQLGLGLLAVWAGDAVGRRI